MEECGKNGGRGTDNALNRAVHLQRRTGAHLLRTPLQKTEADNPEGSGGQLQSPALWLESRSMRFYFRCSRKQFTISDSLLPSTGSPTCSPLFSVLTGPLTPTSSPTRLQVHYSRSSRTIYDFSQSLPSTTGSHGSHTSTGSPKAPGSTVASKEIESSTGCFDLLVVGDSHKHRTTLDILTIASISPSSCCPSGFTK